MTEGTTKSTPPTTPELQPGQKGSGFHRKLEEAELLKEHKSAIKAISLDRGYEFVEGGRLAIVRRFLEEQEGDEFVKEATPTAPELAKKRQELVDAIAAAEAALEAFDEAASRAENRVDQPTAEPGVDDPKGQKVAQVAPPVPQE